MQKAEWVNASDYIDELVSVSYPDYSNSYSDHQRTVVFLLASIQTMKSIEATQGVDINCATNSEMAQLLYLNNKGKKIQLPFSKSVFLQKYNEKNKLTIRGLTEVSTLFFALLILELLDLPQSILESHLLLEPTITTLPRNDDQILAVYYNGIANYPLGKTPPSTDISPIAPQK